MASTLIRTTVIYFRGVIYLGRSSNLQGLAASMIKLWERCEVAKVAIKRGAENIDSDLISEKLKVGW